MANAYRKYLAIVSNDSLINRIKKIADGYWTVGGTVTLFYYEPTKEEAADIGVLRDNIKGDYNGSLALIEIFTRGSAAATGLYANERTWDWIKSFCTDDVEKIGNKAVKDYKEKEAIFSVDDSTPVGTTNMDDGFML